MVLFYHLQQNICVELYHLNQGCQTFGPRAKYGPPFSIICSASFEFYLYIRRE